MKPHVKLYMKHFGYDESDHIPCEIPVCSRLAVDIHHIEARGMGGTKKPDTIENLMALCRGHHVDFGDRKQYKDYLKTVHAEKLHDHQHQGKDSEQRPRIK